MDGSYQEDKRKLGWGTISNVANVTNLIKVNRETYFCFFFLPRVLRKLQFLMPPKKCFNGCKGKNSLTELNRLKSEEHNRENVNYKLKGSQFEESDFCDDTNVVSHGEKFQITPPISRPTVAAVNYGNANKTEVVTVLHIPENSRVSYNQTSNIHKKDLSKGQLCVDQSKHKSHLYHAASATAILDRKDQNLNPGLLTKKDLQLCLSYHESNSDGLKTQRILDWLHGCENADAVEYAKNSTNNSVQLSNSNKLLKTIEMRVQRDRWQNVNSKKKSDLCCKLDGPTRKHTAIKPKLDLTKAKLDNVTKLPEKKSDNIRDLNSLLGSNYFVDDSTDIRHQLKNLKHWSPLLSTSNSILTTERKQLQIKQKQLENPRRADDKHVIKPSSGEADARLRFSSKLPIRSSENLVVKTSSKWSAHGKRDAKLNNSKESLENGETACRSDKSKASQLVCKKVNKKVIGNSVECVYDTSNRPLIKSTLSTTDRIKKQTYLAEKRLKKKYFYILLCSVLESRHRNAKARVYYNQYFMRKNWEKWKHFISRSRRRRCLLPTENTITKLQIAVRLYYYKLLCNYFWKWFWWSKEQIEKKYKDRLQMLAAHKLAQFYDFASSNGNYQWNMSLRPRVIQSRSATIPRTVPSELTRVENGDKIDGRVLYCPTKRLKSSQNSHMRTTLLCSLFLTSFFNVRRWPAFPFGFCVFGVVYFEKMHIIGLTPKQQFV